MLIRLIGDVHGKFSLYNEIISCEHKTLQVGDMGVGFIGDNNFKPTEKDYFINGNHDDPSKCLCYPTYLPSPNWIHDKVFTCGGGFSIDWQHRIPGKSWWFNEELSYQELQYAIEVYAKNRPAVVITHEAPAFMAQYMVKNVYAHSRTAIAFEQMISFHAPKIWVYGHWHMNFRKQVGNTTFICLPELAYADLDIEKLTISETVPLT